MLVIRARPPLWSSGHSPCLQIQRCEFDSRHNQIFREVVSLERGPLSLVSTTEELLGRKSSGSGLENRDYGHRDPSRWKRGTICPQKLVLTSPTRDVCSVGIVRSRTQALVYTCNPLVLLPSQWGTLRFVSHCTYNKLDLKIYFTVHFMSVLTTARKLVFWQKTTE
jgi:hypothetical protein